MISSSHVLRRLYPHLVIFKRNLRAHRRTIRDHLPRYRKDLRHLPRLTGLLTDSTLNESRQARDLRLKKLELYKSYIPDSTSPVLLEALFNPENNLDGLLRIIDENLETMTSFYIGVAFESLEDMIAEKLDRQATVAVSPEFKRLCTRALYKARFFECDEALKVIKCLSTLRMPENLLIVQAALQMTRNLINDFNIDELDTLRRALDRIPVTQEDTVSLLSVLKRAVPLAKSRLVEGRYFTKPEDYRRISDT